MILPYSVRLLCLCLASFFLVNLATGLLVRIFAPAAVRMAERARSHVGARILFGLRVAPPGLALCAVAGLCVPSYLSMEPEALAEPVGFACLAAAFLSLFAWGTAAARCIQAVIRSRRYLVARQASLFALAGILRPRLMLSRDVVNILSAEELAVALRHERAHWKSRDNLKRLVMLLAPDVVPFCRALELLERVWARLAEWAADDEAAAGDAGHSLALASALVRVARLGSAEAPPELLTALTSSPEELSARVERLLRNASREQCPGRSLAWAAGVLPLLVGAMLIGMLRPSTLSVAHEVLERLIR